MTLSRTIAQIRLAKLLHCFEWRSWRRCACTRDRFRCCPKQLLQDGVALRRVTRAICRHQHRARKLAECDDCCRHDVDAAFLEQVVAHRVRRELNDRSPLLSDVASVKCSMRHAEPGRVCRRIRERTRSETTNKRRQKKKTSKQC